MDRKDLVYLDVASERHTFQDSTFEWVYCNYSKSLIFQEPRQNEIPLLTKCNLSVPVLGLTTQLKIVLRRSLFESVVTPPECKPVRMALDRCQLDSELPLRSLSCPSGFSYLKLNRCIARCLTFASRRPEWLRPESEPPLGMQEPRSAPPLPELLPLNPPSSRLTYQPNCAEPFRVVAPKSSDQVTYLT